MASGVRLLPWGYCRSMASTERAGAHQRLRLLTPPPRSLGDAAAWVEENLAGLYTGPARRSRRFVGGQDAAEEALAGLDVAGYGERRSQVHPRDDRGASGLSPYIRHGLLSLPRVHEHPAVSGAPPDDRFRFQGELLWQEYSRHWYAVFGARTRRGVHHTPMPSTSADQWTREPWPDDMKCMSETLRELHEDGWVVNQARMWLASQWSVRAGEDWRRGEDEMFRHLLDGSRAANRQGWQWVVGGTRGRSYGFARRQVLKRAPAWCAECALADDCPIRGYAESVTGPATSDRIPQDAADRLGFGDDDDHASGVEAVWLTAESLGDDDPALRAYPDAPVHFIFDEPLLERWQLSGKRLVFLSECLANLAARREVHAWRGTPAAWLSRQKAVATSRAPVPGFRKLAEQHRSALRLQPWPWLRPPSAALLERLDGAKRFPVFRDWCRLTKPGADE